MSNKITCTCGHSWNKSDSSKKDASVCHVCGKDTTMQLGGYVYPVNYVPQKKSGGWLDKFDVPQAQNGIEGTMGGLTDQGFNYNGAWGGTMQFGGNLPGVVGSMYARTGSPSKGPRRNQTDVTDASAQNGMEMKFYQEGLDWKPRNISKNGGWLDKYEDDVPKAQNALTFEDLVKATKTKAVSDNTNSGVEKKVANQISAQESSNKKAEQKVQTLINKAGYSEAHARRAVKTKEAKANSILEKVSNDTYRTQMHPDFDPNKSVEEQSYLLNDDSFRTRVLRGANMLTNAGNPVGDFATSIFTAPGRSFANLTMDAGNRYFNTNNTGVGNFANFAEDVVNVAPSIIPKAAGALGQVESLIGQGFTKTAKPASISSSVGNIFNKLSLPEGLLEEMRFLNLPKLNNPNATEVLENFKKRIQTPEGQKRLKDLGITDTKVLDDLTIVADENTLGHYWLNKIGLHPKLPEVKRVTRHEIEHAVQNALENSRMNKYNQDSGNFKYLFRPKAKKKAIEDAMKPTSEIDDILSGLELRKTPEKVDWVERRKTRGKLDPSELFNYMLNKQNATNYFDSGSMGKEKSAFLSEVQQYMMDEGIIPKTSYTEITPEMVKETFTNAMFDEKGGKYLRLFNIMKPTTSNYKLVSDALNKMLTVAPIVGGATAAASQPEQKKKGGKVKKDDDGYWNPENWGEPVEIGSNEITMQGVYEPLLGISDTGDTQMMYPGEDYTFDGESVTEYPVSKNGGWLEKYK